MICAQSNIVRRLPWQSTPRTLFLWSWLPYGWPLGWCSGVRGWPASNGSQQKCLGQMFQVCEQYASDLNLVFSTDPDPRKAKSKSICMTGSRLRHVWTPAPLQLYGNDLPWVAITTHLGYELHQDGTMDYDCKIKRAKFIDIRETFNFAEQKQVLNAVQIYWSDCYGSTL